MFRTLLRGNYRIRYRPDMAITHLVDEWKLKRSYFLKLHYRAGLRQGQFRLPTYSKTLFGFPPFLVRQFLNQSLKTFGVLLTGKPSLVRQAMNASNALGVMVGYRRRIYDHIR